jgi:hypothetical protein
VLALVTLLEMTTERGGAAAFERSEHASCRHGQRRIVLRSKRRPVAADDIRHFELGPDHVCAA